MRKISNRDLQVVNRWPILVGGVANWVNPLGGEVSELPLGSFVIPLNQWVLMGGVTTQWVVNIGGGWQRRPNTRTRTNSKEAATLQNQFEEGCKVLVHARTLHSSLAPHTPPLIRTNSSEPTFVMGGGRTRCAVPLHTVIHIILLIHHLLAPTAFLL